MNEVIPASGERPGSPSGEAAAQYLTFRLAGEEYAIEILRVQEIKGWERATRIPHTPHYVLGVVNLRGAIVPLIDMRRRFALEAAVLGATTVIVVVRVGAAPAERTVGLVVDAVCEVHRIAAADVQAPPEVGAGAEAGFIRGVAAVDGSMLILLDLDRLVTASVLEALGARAA